MQFSALTWRLAAVMFTHRSDAAAMFPADEGDALRRLRDQERVVRPVLELHRGQKIHSLGAGLLIEFRDAQDAAECVIDLQQRTHEQVVREEDR